jgi:hypothetical protein
VWAANRFGVDYRAEAVRLGTPVRPIIDGHLHVNGRGAAGVLREVMDLYGIDRLYSQSQLGEAAAVRDVLGDRISFIAIPEYMASDRRHAMTEGFLENLEIWHRDFGARCVKFWQAPRLRDLADGTGLEPEDYAIDGPWRIRIAERAVEMGMMLMAHIADPDTWFATTYKDSGRYGTKADQYEPFERMVDRFPVLWLCAHMGGWPEDLDFLTGLLERHDNLVLDTSATKWMVRELSKHPRAELLYFLQRFKGRIIFGSDLVTHDDHLQASGEGERKFGAELASSPEQAFELYASRYWAQRTMWETDYDGESNIADPDLAKIDPDRYDAMSAPRLVGRKLPEGLLGALYGGALEDTIGRWYANHGSR